jgi:hypothetical protein
VQGVELVPLADGRAPHRAVEGTTEATSNSASGPAGGGSPGDADKRMLKSLLTFVADARRHGGLTVRKILLLRARRVTRRTTSKPRPR